MKMNNMDPYMIRDFAQDMNRALATAESMISHQNDSLKRVRNLAELWMTTESTCLISAGHDLLKALNGEQL
jgi:hypothetical protein